MRVYLCVYGSRGRKPRPSQPFSVCVPSSFSLFFSATLSRCDPSEYTDAAAGCKWLVVDAAAAAVGVVAAGVVAVAVVVFCGRVRVPLAQRGESNAHTSLMFVHTDGRWEKALCTSFFRPPSFAASPEIPHCAQRGGLDWQQQKNLTAANSLTTTTTSAATIRSMRPS